MNFLKSIARLVVKYAGNAVGLGIGGEAFLAALDAWNMKTQGQPEKLAAVQQVAQLSATELAEGIVLEVAGDDQPELVRQAVAALSELSPSQTRAMAEEIVREVAGDQPESVRQTVTAALTQLPNLTRSALCRKFWQGLLDRPAAKTSLPANISPSDKYFLRLDSRIPGLKVVCSILQHEGRVELRGFGGKNFDALNQPEIKAEIKQAFKGELSWKRGVGPHPSKIYCKATTGGWKSDESQWSAIQDAMIDPVDRLEKAVRPHLEKLKS